MYPNNSYHCNIIKNLLIQCTIHSNKLNECTILKSIFNHECKKIKYVYKSSK